MAIAIEQHNAMESGQSIRVDIRKLAAAATLCRKVRSSRRATATGFASAWHVNVLVHGGYVYGGDPFETTVQVPHGGEYAHRAFAVPYDSITAAAKGRTGDAELCAGSITFDDGAVFAWKDNAEHRDDMQAQRAAAGDTEWAVRYAADTFFDAVATVAPSASADKSRPVLTGVYVDPMAEKWAATDSYRMMIASVPNADDDPILADSGETIPAKALRVAATVKRADRFQVRVSERNAAIRYAEIMAADRNGALAILCTRLIEAQYPNYSALIPEGFTVSADCDGDALRAALTSAASVARKPNPIVRLTAQSGASTLRVSVEGRADDPSGEWLVPCAYRGDSGTGTAVPDGELTIGLNPCFALDGATCVGGDVTVNIISPLRPALFTRADNGDISGFDPHYVVMPIRI